MPRPGPTVRALAAAGIAGLATALTTAALPATPRLSMPDLLDLTDSGCAAPAPVPPSELAGTVSTTGTVLAYPRPARPVLHDLALHIAPADCDQASGRFDMVHHRAWYVGDGGEQTTRDVVRWYRDDDSGAELASEHPDPRPGEARSFWLVGDLHYYNLADAFRSGEFLRTRAGSQPMEFLTSLAFLSRWRSPRRTGRILTAQLLADTPGLTAYPHTVDRAGRTGIAVTAISGDGRERRLLILHPSTGEVLAYEHAARTATGWQARIYLLLLTRTHVQRRWWEPSADGGTLPPPQPDRRMMPRHSGVWLVPAEKHCITELTPAGGAPR